MKRAGLFLIISCFVVSIQSQNNIVNTRYKASNYSVEVVKDIIYASQTMDVGGLNPSEADIDPKDLTFDLYTPQGDTHDLRPLIICVHGGGFIIGSKENEDMQMFCDSFASKGYVAVSIEYRLGINLADSKSSLRAMYRSVQDLRAAIRYFRAHADVYKVDASQVYVLGSSAGALAILHNLYMDDPLEFPDEIQEYTYLFQTVPYLGPLDTGAYISFESQANAVIALWGSLLDTNFIQNADQTPLYLMHGTSDFIVPFDYDGPFADVAPFPNTYGSQLISQRLNNLEIHHETYFVDGGDHEFYGGLNGNFLFGPNVYWDTVVNKTLDFYYAQHEPNIEVTYTIDASTVSFQNNTQGAINYYWQFSDATTSTTENPIHTFTQTGIQSAILWAQSPNLSYAVDTVEFFIQTITSNVLFNNNVFKVLPFSDKKVQVLGAKNGLNAFSSEGKLVFNQSFSGVKDLWVDMTAFSAGLYVFQTQGDSQKVLLID